MDIYPIAATFLFTFFPSEVSETTIPFGLLCLAEQLVPCSAPANILARLRPFANTVSTIPFKVLQLPELVAHFSRLQSLARSFMFVCTHACPSAKISPPRDILESLRLTIEKTG
ncbi:hypothetical protein B296_00049221 [Ensete ventricosum]|uniref:Uncharacterized protein n=1 Tax=Ensete ventricosum TaxID=4639 RepID=A0A426XPF4_ENSVE|nr:hypothetical protein B296_00049221 [Ensete ventricosum]